MQAMGFLIEKTKVIAGANGIPPQNISGAATKTNWIGLKHGKKLQFLIQTGAWAGGTSAITLQQATTPAGGGAKALALTRMFYLGGTPASTVGSSTQPNFGGGGASQSNYATAGTADTPFNPAAFPSGTGATVTVTLTSTAISAVTAAPAAAGTGYPPNSCIVFNVIDTGAGTGGQVVGVTNSSGAVADFYLLNAGTGYTGTTGLATSYAYNQDGSVPVALNTFLVGGVPYAAYVIEIEEGDLDMNNLYSYVQLLAGSPGSNADLLSVTAAVYDVNIAGKPSTLASAII